ncbi:MAG: SdpI family protein [Papillibacter sp.]|jgi:uncharacterized membrane protein|nr:SdpI family protein [Papillibacter sp.]
MGFWFFMLIMNMLIPLAMLIFGALFKNKAPKEINYFYGYRTNRSMLNMDTWVFAHKHCGRIWYKVGWIMLLLSLIVMLLCMNLKEDTLGTVSLILICVQLAVMAASIIPTERALRKTFDEKGNRR